MPSGGLEARRRSTAPKKPRSSSRSTAPKKLIQKGLYKGELIMKHGAEEAEEFIQKGKYSCKPDKDGDLFYYTTQKYSDESEQHQPR